MVGVNRRVNLNFQNLEISDFLLRKSRRFGQKQGDPWNVLNFQTTYLQKSHFGQTVYDSHYHGKLIPNGFKRFRGSAYEMEFHISFFARNRNFYMLLQYRTKINSKICTGKFVFVVLKTMNASDKAQKSVTSQGLQLVTT